MPDAPPAPDLPPPFLIADDRALDFLNTTAALGEQRLEWLGDGAGLLRWLEAAAMAPLHALASYRDQPATLNATAEAARARREWFRGIVATRAGAPLRAASVAALAPLNDWLAQDDSRLRLDAAGDTAILHRVRRWDTPGSLLAPLAEAMATLLCDPGLASVRRCEGAGCTLWFRDISARQTRRWCSMALCGNRAKAAAHRARVRGQP